VPNLKGLLVGNGYTNYKYDGLPSFVPMAYYHGIIDDDLHEYLTMNCNLSFADVDGTTTYSQGCKDALTQLEYYASYVNRFDVFGKCYKSTPAAV
jgi:hypothetical protein